MATTTQLKLYTHSTYSTRAHSIYLGYLSHKLLSIDYTQTPKVSVQDWKENKDKIVLRKVAKNTYLLYIENDCYSQSYTNLEEAVFDLISYVETNLTCSNLLLTNKGTLQ